MISQGTLEAIAGYRWDRRALALAVVEAKQCVWEKFGKDIQNNTSGATNRTVYSKGGTLMTGKRREYNDEEGSMPGVSHSGTNSTVVKS